MCVPGQTNGFSCPATQVFHVSTIIVRLNPTRYRTQFDISMSSGASSDRPDFSRSAQSTGS